MAVCHLAKYVTPLAPTPTPTPSPCVGTLSAGRATVSRGESTNITLAMTDGTLSSVSWSTTAGALSNQANTGATITAPATGAGSMTITAAMTCSGWKTTASVTISVAYAAATPTPTPVPATPTPTPSPCVGTLSAGRATVSRGESSNISLSVTDGTLSSVSWSTTAGALSNQANSGATITAPATGAGSMTITAAMTCSGWKTTASVTISVAYAAPTPTPVPPTPTPAPTPTPDPDCYAVIGGARDLGRGRSADLELRLVHGELDTEQAVAWTATDGELVTRGDPPRQALLTAPSGGDGNIRVAVDYQCVGGISRTAQANVGYRNQAFVGGVGFLLSSGPPWIVQMSVSALAPLVVLGVVKWMRQSAGDWMLAIMASMPVAAFGMSVINIGEAWLAMVEAILLVMAWGGVKFMNRPGVE